MENLTPTTTNNAISLQEFDLTKELPNLQQAQVIPAELTSEYWTPKTVSEFKLVFFQEIKNSTYTNESTGEVIEMPCAFMLEQKENGELKRIRNGSKRLVASLEDALKEGKIIKGTPLRIEYIGKEKNTNNSYMSDRWSVKPLIVNI